MLTPLEVCMFACFPCLMTSCASRSAVCTHHSIECTLAAWSVARCVSLPALPVWPPQSGGEPETHLTPDRSSCLAILTRCSSCAARITSSQSLPILFPCGERQSRQCFGEQTVSFLSSNRLHMHHLIMGRCSPSHMHTPQRKRSFARCEYGYASAGYRIRASDGGQESWCAAWPSQDDPCAHLALNFDPAPESLFGA